MDSTLTGCLGFATTSSDPASSTDPSFSRALNLLGEGTRLIEEGDVEGALSKYKESVKVKETSGGFFNLGVSFTASRRLDSADRSSSGLRIYSECVTRRYVGRVLILPGNHPAAIDAWEKSIKLGPSADAYTSALLLEMKFGLNLSQTSHPLTSC